LRGQATKPPARFEVTCDGTGVVGHAGAALLVELADRLGLTRGAGLGGQVAPRPADTATTRARCCGIWRCCWPMAAIA
jgi:hypothetical protein